MSETSTVESIPLTKGEKYRQQFQMPVDDFPRVPVPIYRHAMPSAPWPWMNFKIDPSEVRPTNSVNAGWDGYPQSLFGNWTQDQVDRSQMLTKCSDRDSSTVYKIYLLGDGKFDQQVEERIIRKDDTANLQDYWNCLKIEPSSNVRVQAIFVDEMTLPVLRMLGTKYNVEPFFFASSVNWIPSRYQEDSGELQDHITVVLPFLRILKKQRPIRRAIKVQTFVSDGEQSPGADLLPYTKERQMINTQAPLSLLGNKILIQDLLSIHMVRKATTNTIISYHPPSSFQGTSAQRLQSLVRRTGDSVYWSKHFKGSKDSTFLFLAMLWYALYAWDEAFEELFRYINKLEREVLQFNDIIKLTRELHKLQSNLLYYQQLLRDFKRSVEFVRDTPNPAMRAPSIDEKERRDSARALEIEANILISEILRLNRQREIMSARLDNVIKLAFSTVNIEDSMAMRGLAEVATQDSAAIKQIAYLSMVFLPAAFMANVFSMNVREINPMYVNGVPPPVVPPTRLANFVETSVPLTVFISWLAIALQEEHTFIPRDSGILRRVLWPLCFAYSVVSTEFKKLVQDSDRRVPPNIHIS